MVDDGETLSRDLFGPSWLRGRDSGRRPVFEIVRQPARPGQWRSIDPSGPRADRRDLASDRILRGIYRFEGDQLVICHLKPEEPRPDTFDALRIGPMLLRLTLASDSSAPSAPASRNQKDAPESAPATAATTRRPTESELARVTTCSRGTGNVSILDDGKSLGPELIPQRFAQSGRVQFGTRAFATTNPRTEEPRISAWD